MALTAYHAFENGVRWRLVPAGVDIDGSGVERTAGAPATVTRVWERFHEEINRTARARRVPCALIVATICTESGGNPDAVRLEPGYKSDEETPHKVSPGLMQTLISTAREALQMSLDRHWLLTPGNSIEAGTAYIAKQARFTNLDPPLVAAAYNAGKLRHQDGAENRWKLRQFPIGTGKHCDRFVKFFNDAVFVLARHDYRPAVGLDDLLGDCEVKPSANRGAIATGAEARVQVRFAQNAKAEDVTPFSMRVLEDTLRASRCKSALVSSTSRTPADQARIMFENCERHGVEAQHKLYGPAGDKVIDVYAKGVAARRRSEDIKRDMELKIIELGPTNVSKHTADPQVYNVFDVAPSSISDKVAFERAVKADSRVKKFFTPADSDPAFHLEIPQPK